MVRVAIVGGGMGGLAAAFDLVANHPGEYEIDIYERDWRLGGKGASGRNPAPDRGKRIEEHGLHVLMGFYENVFEILKRCYADLRDAGKLPTPAPGHAWWQGVLHGLDSIFFSEPPHGATSHWVHWHVGFPPRPGESIGDPAQALPTVKKLLVAAFKRFVEHLLEGEQKKILDDDDVKANIPELKFDSEPDLHSRTDDAAKRSALGARIRAILRRAHDKLDLTNERHHRWFVALYFAGLNLIGILDEVLPDEENFRDELDKHDYKDWLAKYNFLGLADLYHRESAPVNAVYDLVFSRNRGFAAGSALYDTMLMLFHHKGHIFYKMAGGMGDVIFAPLYLWLRDRGVKFHWFHDLTDLELSADQTKVEKLIFNVSLAGIGGAEYDPVVDVECADDDNNVVTLPCWPSQPDSSLLQVGPGQTVVTSFDAVVLAIPVGAIRETVSPDRARCEALYVDADFKSMATKMVTRCTRAVQLWFTTDLAGLGWKVPTSSPALGPVLGSYQPPFKHNSWADMTQVLRRETWPTGTAPQNIAYLCDVFDDDLVGEDARGRVREEAIQWLTEIAGGLWPNTEAPFPWELLHDPGDAQGTARFDSQYWRANTDGSSQYVLGAPDTTSLRLDPHGTQFTNLFLAGDWVKTPLNAGCVEGAAMGGRLAARRIAEQTATPMKARQATAVLKASSPAYIERDGDLPLLQPVVLGDLTMHGYVLKADRDTIAERLRATFEPLGISCKPIGPFVLATSVQAAQIRSKVRPDDGFMTEAELGFWLPVRMKWNGGSSTGLYLPYLFVDNPAAMLAGRDIYGFNKILGLFSYSSPGDIDPVEVKAQVLHTRAAATRLEWQAVAAIKTSNPQKVKEWSSSDEIVNAVAAKIAAEHPEAKLGAKFKIPSFPLFFLKQFRAAADGSRACIQNAITAHVSVEQGTVSGGWLDKDDVELTFTRHATLDIAATLGLSSTVSPWLAFWAKCTATVETGTAFGGAGDAEG